MKTLCILLLIGLVSNQAMGLRLKRQTNEQDTNLDDRYGWIQQTLVQSQWQIPDRGQRPGQFPGQRPGQFPGEFPGQFPGQFPGGQQQLTTSTNATPSTSSSGVGEATMSTDTQACISRCLVTTEYNPVCGSNRVTYDNIGRLECAKACGVSVTLFRTSRCPPAPAPAQ